MFGTKREYLTELEREREVLIKRINREQVRLSQVNSEIGRMQRELAAADAPQSREGGSSNG